MAHKVDAIVLATGDGDFIPCVEYVKSLGCQVEAITFARSASSGLKSAVDDFIDLDADPKKFLIGFRPTKKRSAQKPKKGTSDKHHNKTKVVGSDTDGLLD